MLPQGPTEAQTLQEAASLLIAFAQANFTGYVAAVAAPVPARRRRKLRCVDGVRPPTAEAEPGAREEPSKESSKLAVDGEPVLGVALHLNLLLHAEHLLFGGLGAHLQRTRLVRSSPQA